MSLLTWSPTSCPEGQLLSISPSESDEGRDVGSTTVVEFFQYDPCGKFDISKCTKFNTKVRAVTWTKHEGGVLAFGSDDGSVFFPKLSAFFDEALDSNDVMTNSKSEKHHSGAVSSFDWNHFQPNLVCSGSADSSVFIWDLNKPDTHMVPGHGGTNAGTHADAISTVAWNLQVQHILGTASSSKATIWDLRKSEPVIRLTDGLCRLKPELLCWSPDVATQLVIASLDSANTQPVIQLWDLKQPTAPVKSLSGHKDGITSMSWCFQESGLLLSSGKDGTVLLWDPCSGNLLGNLFGDSGKNQNGVIVESLAWSPIDPGVFIALRSDGKLSLHNILSGSQGSLGFAKTTAVRERKASRRDVLDAFDQLDSEPAKDMSHDDLYEMVENMDSSCVVPAKAPRWMAPKCCARFSFANRLVTCSANSGLVAINQVVTDDVLVSRAHEVANVLAPQQHDKRDTITQFATQRAASCEDADIQLVWKFLDASVKDQQVPQYMSLLGVDSKAIPDKVYGTTGRILENMQVSPGASQVSQTMSDMNTPRNDGANGEPCVEATEPYRLPEDEQDEAGESLIVDGLLSARPEVAVDACLFAGRFADALVLSASANQQLFMKTLQYVMRSAKDPISRLVSGICLGDLDSVATYLDVAQWPTCLAIILTYAMDKEYLSDLAECLADRLEQAQMFGPAAVCHIVSTNISSFSKCISQRISEREKYQDKDEFKDLFEQAELLLTYAGAVLPKSAQGDIELDDDSIRTLAQYAKLLVEQGELNLAFEVVKLTPSSKLALLELRHRLYYALNLTPKTTGLPLPSVPFRRLEVKASPSLATLSSQRSSAATEESLVMSTTGLVQPAAGGVAFQLGGKPMTAQHYSPQQPPPPTMPQALQPPHGPPVALSHMYSPTFPPQQHVEHINPESSNVLAPAAMPALSQPTFYNPAAHVGAAQQQNAQFVPQSQPYYPPPPSSSIPPPPMPGQMQPPQQMVPPPPLPGQVQPPQQMVPPPPMFGQMQQPQQAFPPPPMSGQMQQPQQMGPPPVQRVPSFQSQQMAPPPAQTVPFQPQQYVPQQPQQMAPPPMQFQPQQMNPVPPPPMPGQQPVPQSMMPPPPMPTMQQQQQQQQQQPRFSPPPPRMMSPQQGSYFQPQPPSQMAPPPGMPQPQAMQRNASPPPMPGQFQPTQTQQQMQPPLLLPSNYVLPGSRPAPSYPPAMPQTNFYNPATAIPPTNYPPAASPQFQPQQQQQGEVFLPNQPPYMQPPQQGPPPPLALPACTLGSAGDMQQQQQQQPGIPRVRSYIDRRPSNNWNDPPVTIFSPLNVDTNGAPQGAPPGKSPGTEPSPSNSVSSQPPERVSPKVAPELQPIVDALCELFNKCMDAAPHGTRKKLEDVDKKMPMLYEKLRLKQVSPGIVACLHQLCAAIRNNDFAGAMVVCQQMTGAGQFVEVGQFMLPIKLLLHSAQQLNIHM